MKPINDSEPEGNWGAATKSGCQTWFTCLSNAMEDFFEEGVRVLDYGCGNGRYANFLSERLEDFTYYGVDIAGTEGIPIAQKHYVDPRVRYGYIGDELEKEALKNADVMLLGSVFTHVTFEEMKRITEKAQPLFKRGGIMVFSIFIGDSYMRGTDGTYGIEDCYKIVYNTQEQIDECFKGLHIKEFEPFDAGGGTTQRIFKVWL